MRPNGVWSVEVDADEGSQLYINNGRMKVDNGRIIID